MRFASGDLVCLIADTGRVGSVLVELPPIAGVHQYRVFHGPGSISEYSGIQLTLVAEANGPQAVFPASLLDPEALRAHLTAARLRHPRTDDVYALTAARIQFIPFQFRPVIRLLRADEPRLLIADEVGVGKTIEAGLILQELSARTSMETVLVVCPKALTVKWQKEMLRFDESFRILDSASLKYCLQETHNDGAWPSEYSRAIVHYELLRHDSYLMGDERKTWPGLLELDPPPVFDLVIADEAHHMSTVGTNSNELAQYLGQASNAFVMLTATPLQMGSGDLFSLLNKADPESEAEFGDDVSGGGIGAVVSACYGHGLPEPLGVVTTQRDAVTAPPVLSTGPVSQAIVKGVAQSDLQDVERSP